MKALSWAVACTVLAGYFAAAGTHEDPLVMLVGLFPLAWIAIELAWRLLEPRGGEPQAARREPPRRTGMRRGPNGLPNFW